MTQKVPPRASHAAHPHREGAPRGQPAPLLPPPGEGGEIWNSKGEKTHQIKIV